MSISDFKLARDGKRLLREPRERQILRELIAPRQTHTYQATADALNARGYTTRSGKPFTVRTVQVWQNSPSARTLGTAA